ncbi:hypothetical protein LguiA_002921 [Lonicera macranthoides]
MAFHRRRHHNHHRFRFLIPVISSVSGALLLLFAFLSFLAPTPNDNDHLHRYPQRFASASGGISDRDIWSSKSSQFYYGCSNASDNFLKTEAEAMMHPTGYLLIATSGGLNQQRTGITDGVVAARILNATLVVPTLDQKSFWKDASNFSEIFDVDWFISNLSKDVKIIKALPLREGKPWTPYTMRVPRKCNERCYQTRLLRVFVKRGAVRLTKFDYRLSNRLDPELQKLRCRVNYHALRFTNHITEMGKKLVQRMRTMSRHYIALHLRFEPDMLAFSGCYYGGGEKERTELGKIRRRWKTLHKSNPDKGRRQGRCPLTPEEVGLMLRALGYDKDVHIYVASGEVYRGEETLAPLKALFPNFHSKETIASKEELQPFFGFSSRMAALDFTVCDESDVFVTNNNGNMAKMLAGRRRYFGHKPTIRPNAKKLYRLFLNRENMTWEEFASGVRTRQKGFMGAPMEVRPGRGVFHENPYPCICQSTEAKAKMEDKGPRKLGIGKNSAKKKEDTSENVDDQSNENNEIEWSDREDEDDLNLQGQNQLNETSVDYDPSVNEERELEEMLSD